MKELRYLARDEDATTRLGTVLAEVLPTRGTLALIGTLGAGKTRLVQALAAASGVPRKAVVSPTYVLCQPYSGRRTLYHLDAYRLRDEDEFLELGPEEYFESDGLTVIEWADRVLDCLPAERLEIHIEVVGQTARQFRLIALGSAMEGALEEVAERVEA